MHKGHLNGQFFIARITFLDLLRDFVIFFFFLFRIINLHSQTGSSKEVCVCEAGVGGGWGGGGGWQNPFKFTQTVLYI